MTWLFYAVDFIGNCLDDLVILSFFRSVSGSRHKSLRTVIIVCVLMTLMRSAVSLLLPSRTMNLVCSLLAIAGLSSLYDMPQLKRMIFSPIMLIMMFLSEALVMMFILLLTGLSQEEASSNILIFTGCLFVSKMLLLSFLKLVHFIVPSFGEKIPGYLLVPLTMLPVATFLMTFALGEYTLQDGTSTLTYYAVAALLLLTVANIGLFFLLEYQQREEKEKARMHLMQKQTEGQIAYYRELAERQKVSNKTMHDLKNQMFALSEAMKTAPGKTQEIMENITGRIFAASPMKITGIDAVDSLIFTKQQQMETLGIRFEHAVYISPGCSVDPLDMCILLGNLLDNAIEANEHIAPESRYVSLSITQQEQWLSITIRNAASRVVPLDGKTIRTTKAQKELHGFGLSSVREIASKYQGDCTFRSTDQDFTSYLILQVA